MSRSEPPQINALWQHSTSGKSFQLQATPQMSSNHRAAVQQFCEAGLGIALLDAIVSDDPTALIGLPLIRTCQLLRAAGVVLP